jgi:hypothetical protein
LRREKESITIRQSERRTPNNFSEPLLTIHNH